LVKVAKLSSGVLRFSF